MKTASLNSVNFSSLGQRAQLPTIARLMTMALDNPQLLSLAAGFTDNQTLPVDSITRAVQALAERKGEPEHLQYGSSQGRAGLRRVVAERLRRAEPSLPPTEALAERVFVTNGSQQALYLAMQVLCDPGDIVLVDRPSYFVFLEMLTGLGIRARSIPVNDHGGLDEDGFSGLLDELERTGDVRRLKAIYFVSYFSNPSGKSLTIDEKNRLAEILSARSIILPVLEDAAYRELYFRTPEKANSVMTSSAWDEFPQLYLSTLTKPFATGLKIGFGICSDPAWLAKMLFVKAHHDFGSSHFDQSILQEVLSNGEFDQQLARVRGAYENKCDALNTALEKGGLRQLGWQWSRPAGGLYLWLRSPKSLDTGLAGAFCRACIAEGVLYVPGELCFGDDPPKNFVRLSFGVLPIEKLGIAGARFSAVAHQFY